MHLFSFYHYDPLAKVVYKENKEEADNLVKITKALYYKRKL
jgi:hypothetical protein